MALSACARFQRQQAQPCSAIFGDDDIDVGPADGCTAVQERDIVFNCQQILGAYGYIKEFDMERHVRDVLVMPILGGSSAIQKNNIANMLRLKK